MPSLKTVKTANKPQIDSKGFCKGNLIDLVLTDVRSEKIDGKTVKFGPQWEFVIESNGTTKPITFRFWTGTTLSTEKVDGRLNKLTTVLTNLNAIKLNEIVDGFEFDLETLIGVEIKFKLEKVEGKKLERIDLATIQLS
jgi:hypothetical protein